MSLFTPDTSKLYAKRDVQGLIKALRHKKGGVRRSAAEALGKLGDPSAVEPLIAVLDEREAHIRSTAVSALASINAASTVGSLIAALDDQSRAEGAAEALGEIGDPRAAEPLIAVLDDKEHSGRQPAAKALGQLGTPRVVDRLIAALKDESSWVRWGAADGLAGLGDDRAVEALIDAVSDEQHPGRDYAAEALGRVDDPQTERAIEPLIEMLGGDSPLPEAATTTLGELGDSRAVEPLIASLGRARYPLDDRWLAAAATALRKLGDPRAIGPLQDCEPPLGEMREFHSRSAIREAISELSIVSPEAAAHSRESSAHASAWPPVPEDIAKLVEEALAIVGANVEVGAGVVHVSGAGSEGPIMPAVERLRTAHKRHPDLPVVHFAYCSALKIAMQNAEARSELEALAAEHPDFALARWTLADGGRWTSGYFALPEWGPATGSLPAMIGQQVIGCVLLAVRDGIEPRATLFFRDRGGHFANPVALRSASVEVAMVVDKLSGAPVVGIYARVWDNPNSPMTMESHGLPLATRGSAMRRAYEHLCGQLDLDFVVIANDDRVLMNRRLDMSAGMVARLVDLGTLLDHEEEHEYEPARLRAAINSHQERYSAANVFHD